MSFGFSVGDFLAVIGLVTQLRKDFADAPSQLRDLSAELRTFLIVLQDAEVDLTASDLDARQLEALESTLSGARDFLQGLQRFIDHNKDISDSTSSKSRGKLKRIWKRLNFDQQEVSKFRLQISSIISGLQTFTSNQVKHNTRKIARYIDRQVHRDILKWLSDDDFNYHKNYQSHLVRNRQAGTRKWLLGSDEWKLWLKSGGQTLYCPGIPGSGKTYTTAMVIENMDSLSEEHGWVFAYVFCNYQQRKENMHEMLLRSLLRMILEQTQQISDEIQHWPTRNNAISIDEILKQLRVSLKQCPRAFIIVDALDELDMFQDVVSCFFDLQNSVDVNLYFTSRDIPHIQAFFDKAMIVPVKATKHDVEVYLDDQMRMSHVPTFIRNNQALQDEIKKTIVSTVGEMRVDSDLSSHFKHLMQTKSTRRLQIALKAIISGTSTYETAYEAAMERIQTQDKRLCELAKNAISILAYAERPLVALELVHALSVDLDFDEGSYTELQETGNLQSITNSLGVYDPDLEPTVEEVLAASAGLIVHQPDSGIVQLVHKTTKEYLMSEGGRQKWFPQAQLTIAAICLIYSQAFEDSDGTTDWPFLDYTQKHYGHHIMAQQNLERRKDPAHIQSSHESVSASDSSVLQAEKLIDQIGLARMAEELAQTEDALVKACERNQLSLVRVLLSTKQYNLSPGISEKPGANSCHNEASCAIDRALLAAVREVHLEVVECLLKSGAYSRSQVQPDNTDAGSHIEADCAIDEALLISVRNGHLELFDLLLKNGANPMINYGLTKRDYSHPFLGIYRPVVETRSLLAEASLHGHCNVVSYLLDNGYYTMDMMQHDCDRFRGRAEFPRKPEDFRVLSPICSAAYIGHSSCVRILLKWIGIENNPSGRDTKQDRILEHVTLSAMLGECVDVLEMLPRLSMNNIDNMIRRLGDPNLLFTSIRWAKGNMFESIKHKQRIAGFFLSAYTFDWSTRDATGANALTAAAKKDMAEVVRLILEKNEDSLNCQDHSGRTAVSWAAELGQCTFPVLLGHKGTCLALMDSKGFAPMDYFLEADWEDMIPMLPLMIPILEHGINTVDRHGCIHFFTF